MKRCPFCAEEIQDAAALCRYCGREVRPVGPRVEDPPAALSRVLRLAELALGLGAVLFVGYLLAGRLQTAAAGDGPFAAPPHVLSLLSVREVDLPAGDHYDTLFTVEDPRPCLLTGWVTGVAGGRHDVEVLVLDEAGYEDWHNGGVRAPLYRSGRTAAAHLEVPLPRPGEYALVVSNAFSLLTGKTVRMEQVQVRCG